MKVAPHRPSPPQVIPGAGMNSAAWRLPSVIVPVLSSSNVFTSPAASTARPDMASTLCCTSRSMPAMPIAESRPPMVVGNQTDQQRDEYKHRLRRSRVNREWLQRNHGQQEDDGQTRQQNVERDFIRSLLPLCAFDQRNHPVEEGLARIRSDAHFDHIGEHACAAGDRRAVTSSFADHRSGFACNGGLVHRGDAFDDLAIARNEFAAH